MEICNETGSKSENKSSIQENKFTEKIVCPECSSHRIAFDNERAETVCINCGFILNSRVIDMGPEWRAYNNEQEKKRARAGAPQNLLHHDKGLSTIIDYRNQDATGRKISIKQRPQIHRLRKWQQRIRVSGATERTLTFALSEIMRIGNKLLLPRNVLETASFTYRKAVKKRLIRGRSIEGMVAATIYSACRQCKLTRTLPEVSEASNITEMEIWKNYRFLLYRLGIRVPQINLGRYVTKFSTELYMPGRVEKVAHRIVAEIKQLKITSGRSPRSLAAAICYAASLLTGERRTQREVAEVAQITEVTVRNRYKEIVRRLILEIRL
jgi:transcription initiation factor TFIIB